MASLDDSVSSFVDVAASLNQALPQAGPISSTPDYLNAITSSSSHNIDGSSSSSAPGHSSSSSARRDPADYADDDYDDDDDDDDDYPDNYSDNYNSEDSEDTDAEDDEYGESEDFRQRRNITYDFHPVHTPLNQIRSPMARTAGISQAAEDKTPLFLDVEPIGRQKIAFARLETWRNNLVGVSRYGFIFIADGVKIKVFKMLSSSRPELTLFTQLTPPKTNPPTRTQILGANNPMDLFCINALRMGSLGGEEHFAVLTDAGQCHVYATSAILRGHDKEGAGERARDMLPIETLQVEKSAWGVDFHDRECLVAVSDNTRSITVFRLGIKEALENWDHGKAQRDHTRRRQETEDFDTDYSAGSDVMATASASAAQATTTDPGEASSSSGSSSRPKTKRTRGSDELRPHEPQNKRNLDLAKFKVRIVEAHDNNIPCIQFMDIPLRESNGRVAYRACISSTAIDGDLKLWDVNTKECIASAAFPNKKGWHTKILWRHDFLNVANSDVITNVKRESFKTVDPVTLAHTETDPRLVLSFPTKSHNPYMNIFFRHQRHDSPFKIYDSAGTPLSAFETVIDSSTRPTMLSQERLDAEFLGVPTSQVSATPSAYLLHPTMSDKKRNETYIIDDLIVYHGSLYQTRLLDFSPDNGEMQLCNMCPTVFGTRVDYEKFSASYDRLNMAITIRELACLIVATQQGSVSIFKCCRVDDTRQAGLRQEYVIGRVKNSGSTNPLIGLDVAVVDSQADAYHRRYLLFVVFINGTVETYEIGRSRNAASGDDVLDFEEHVF
ncbi:CRT10-domain-containing protein [Myxozyma melibiosi]|uniref:CRT10-domain-containing protein n=1 Tax=Myxozyma melibiosi TaxID=54550 RepID=A0ABR1FE05_9ASCO